MTVPSPQSSLHTRSSPLHDEIRRTSCAAIAGCALVSAGIWWAYWPLQVPAALSLDLPPTPLSKIADRPIWQHDAFEATLWQIPAAPTVATVSPPPPLPAPMKLQLIAIVSISDDNQAAHGRSLRAALYDPDSDATIFARFGEMIAGGRVAQLSEFQVTLVRGDLAQTWKLDHAPPMPVARGTP